MQITSSSNNSIEIKIKTATIVAGEKTKVNDITLSGPGEYEISGIEIFGLEGDRYVFRGEDISVAYLVGLNRELTDEEMTLLTDISILFISAGGEKVLDEKATQMVIKALEPRVVIPIGTSEAIERFCKTSGGCQEPLAIYKITKVQIDLMEGQTIIPLIPQK